MCDYIHKQIHDLVINTGNHKTYPVRLGDQSGGRKQPISDKTTNDPVKHQCSKHINHKSGG